jgi:hypothetical protein
MVEITATLVLQIVQTIALLVGIIYYITIMRNSQKTQELTLQSQELTRKAQEQTLETRQAQLFMGVYNQLGDPLLIDAWNYYRGIEKVTEELMKDEFSPENPEHLRNMARRLRLSLFFEGLGTLVREDLVPIRLVALMIQGMVRPYWEKMEDYVYENRSGYPSMGSEIEYLYKAMMKYIEDNPDFYKS